MTDYTKQAAEQLAAEMGYASYPNRSILEHERARALKAEAELAAFKQSVSEAVKIALDPVGALTPREALSRFILPDPETTLADVLKSQGYRNPSEDAFYLTEAAARLGVEIIVKRKDG